MPSKNFPIIISELKSLNYDSYLCSTVALQQDFEKIATIFLLQAELKKISDIASENMIGMIRLAWWKENLEDVFLKNSHPQHHILEAILSFKDEVDFNLLSQSFQGFEKDFLEEKKFQKKSDLEDYIFKTYEVFFLIILKILKFPDEILAGKIAKNLSVISFYFDLLKKIKSEDEKTSRFFYEGFFEELKIEIKDWQKSAKENNHEGNLLVIVKHFSKLINEAAFELKKIEKSLPQNSKNLLLKKDLTSIFLKDLRKNNFDLFQTNFSAKKLSVKLKFLGIIFRNSLF